MIPAGYYSAKFVGSRVSVVEQEPEPSDSSVADEEGEENVIEVAEVFEPPPRSHRPPSNFVLTRLYDTRGRIEQETWGDVLDISTRKFEEMLSDWDGKGGLLRQYLRRRYDTDSVNAILELLQRARNSPVLQQVLGLTGLGMAVSEAEIILLVLKSQNLLSLQNEISLFD